MIETTLDPDRLVGNKLKFVVDFFFSHAIAVATYG
jgi:hypothetical protein